MQIYTAFAYFRFEECQLENKSRSHGAHEMRGICSTNIPPPLEVLIGTADRPSVHSSTLLSTTLKVSCRAVEGITKKATIKETREWGGKYD